MKNGRINNTLINYRDNKTMNVQKHSITILGQDSLKPKWQIDLSDPQNIVLYQADYEKNRVTIPRHALKAIAGAFNKIYQEFSGSHDEDSQ